MADSCWLAYVWGSIFLHLKSHLRSSMLSESIPYRSIWYKSLPFVLFILLFLIFFSFRRLEHLTYYQKEIWCKMRYCQFVSSYVALRWVSSTNPAIAATPLWLVASPTLANLWSWFHVVSLMHWCWFQGDAPISAPHQVRESLSRLVDLLDVSAYTDCTVHSVSQCLHKSTETCWIEGCDRKKFAV